MPAIPPNIVGLIFAKRIEIYLPEHELSLVGLFQGRSFADFPSVPLEMIAFAIVNGGRGEGTLELAVYSLHTSGDYDPLTDWVYRQRKWIKFPNDPNFLVSLELRIRNLVFLEAGEYLFELTFDGKLVAERRMSVRERQVKP